MRQLLILLLASFMLSATLHSQSLPSAPEPANTPSADDQAWDRLTSVDGNTVVFVKSNHRTTRCENLQRERPAISPARSTSSPAPRAPSTSHGQEVPRVRERLGDGDSGIAIVAAVAGGFLWGHSRDRPALHTVDGIVVGSAFGVAAWKLTAVALHFLPGKTIYRHPAKAPDAESR